jgi:hypothetical protein
MRLASALLLGLAGLILSPTPALTKPPTQEELEKAAQRQAEELEKAAQQQAIAADEAILRKAGLGVDGADLLDYFRQRTYKEGNAVKIAELVHQLSSNDFSTREKAQKTLLALGPGTLPALRKAASDPDAETRRRVHELISHFEERADPAIQSAVARLLGARKPAGAAAVLLNYLPFASDELVREEICTALVKVAVRDGKVEPAIRAGLTDKLPLKRAAAGAALAQTKEELPTVRKLLADPEAPVRLRVALSLVRNKDKAAAKEAVPILIGLLGQLPPEQLWDAEDVLTRLAGEKAPRLALSSDAASRQAAKKAWQEWWAQNKDKVDLAALSRESPYLGYTLFVQQVPRVNPNPGFVRLVGEVVELDAQGKVRWRFDVDGFPVHACMVGANHVLVAEYNARRVTERDTKGKILWQYHVPIALGLPLSAQRLANGNTFIVTQNRLLEVNRQGKEVWSYNQINIFRGLKLRTGEVICITGNGAMIRLDAQGKEIKTTWGVNPGNLWGTIDALPSGRVLVPMWGMQCVVEYDRNGKEVRRIPAQLPNSAVYLPKGHILVSSSATRRISVLDRTGREVWSYVTDGQQLFMARRR